MKEGMIMILGRRMQKRHPNGPRIPRDKKTATLLMAVFLWFTFTGLLLDIQRILGKDDTGIVGVKMVAGEEGHAAEIHAHVAFTDAFT